MPTLNPKSPFDKRSFREMALAWARMNLGAGTYVQGLAATGVMLWLRLGCGAQTMLSHGDADAALVEAEQKLDQIKADLRRQVEEWKESERRRSNVGKHASRPDQ